MKKKRLFNLLIIILLSTLLPTFVFAETKIITVGHEDEFTQLSGQLEISNFKADIPELVGKEINMISISKEEGIDEYKHDIYLDNAFVLDSPSKFTLKLDKPTMTRLDINKLTKRGDEYTYIFRDTLPISNGKVEPNDLMDVYHSGVTIDLKEAGDYLLEFTVANDATISLSYTFIRVEEGTEVNKPEAKPTTNNLNAIPTASKVLVNGVETLFDAYLIEGNNYFKLRDLASVVKGSEKQFEVKWDGEKNAINLIPNTPYTITGDELSKGDGVKKAAVSTNSNLYVGETELDIVAFKINNHNYFKLRDIAKAFDIGITWDNKTNSIGIDTSIGYEN